MMNFSIKTKQTLSSYSVIVNKVPKNPLSPFPQLIGELKDWCGTDNDGIAVSYFFRQYALFVTAQFDLITRHGCYFAGSLNDLHVGRAWKLGYPLLDFHIDASLIVPVEPQERFDAFYHVLIHQTEALIQAMRTTVKISPIILWENVLGSLIWFYAVLEKQDPRRTAEDLEWLTDPANWQPAKTSYFGRLLGTASLQHAVSKPLRKTCCLYKDLSNFEICAFCPAVK